MTNPSTPRPHRRLRADKALGLRFDACVALNFSYVSCRACERACPTGALRATRDALLLADTCGGCGRCAAACATGALRIEGCDVPTAIAPQAPVVQVDCRRVPQEESPAHAVRVPCIGGLAVSQWLALVDAAEGRPVRALDRGWCERCPAGGAHFAHASLDEAGAMLVGIGLPSTRIPARRARPLSPELALPEASRAGSGPDVSRRGFFAQLARGVGASLSRADADAATPRSGVKPGGLAAPERERRVALLDRLARRNGAAVPAQALAQLRASDRCRDHRVCAAVCPTGALQAYAAEGTAGIAFDAAACIECGACTDKCVEHALELGPRAMRPLAERPARLTFLRVVECSACGAPCTDGEALCTPCRKSRELAADAFETMFGGAPPDAPRASP